MGHSNFDPVGGPAWNVGRKLGAKPPLKPKEIWAVRFMLDQDRKVRDRALFDLATDGKLRGCDLVKIKISELVSGGRIRNRATGIQQKTNRPVQPARLDPAGQDSRLCGAQPGQFEILGTSKVVDPRLARAARQRTGEVCLSKSHRSIRYLSTRQYARVVDE